jgi:hypothetical protein
MTSQLDQCNDNENMFARPKTKPGMGSHPVPILPVSQAA